MADAFLKHDSQSYVPEHSVSSVVDGVANVSAKQGLRHRRACSAEHVFRDGQVRLCNKCVIVVLGRAEPTCCQEELGLLE